MALSKMEDVRKLTDEELSDEIGKVKRDLFELRFQKATRQVETGFHQFKQLRHRLAQLMTAERERQIAATSSSEGQ